MPQHGGQLREQKQDQANCSAHKGTVNANELKIFTDIEFYLA